MKIDLYPDPDDERAAPVQPAAGVLGMKLFLVSLGVLFTASIIGYLVVRSRAEQWPPAGSPGLPATLWLSTALLIVSSLTMWLALKAIRRGDRAGLKHWLVLTTALGVAFLLSQGASWLLLTQHGLLPRASLFAFVFYTLTALHGLHVVGGLIPMAITTVRAARGRYTATSHPGVVYVSMYWHFLDVVWLILFILLEV